MNSTFRHALAATALIAVAAAPSAAIAKDPDAHTQTSLTVTLSYDDGRAAQKLDCGKELEDTRALCYGFIGDQVAAAREAGASKVRTRSTFDNGDWTDATYRVPATDAERFTTVSKTSFSGRERTFRYTSSIDEYRQRLAEARAKAKVAR